MTTEIPAPSSSATENKDETVVPPERWSRWRAGLLVATSAALGGIAVAIWNRRILAQMRQPPATDD